MQKTLRVLALLGGLCIASIGLLAGLGGVAIAFTAASDARLTFLLITTSLSLLSMVLGSALAWQAWRSITARASLPWQPRRIWVGLLLLAAAILLGRWAVEHPPLDLVVLPGAHVLATALPPAIILALVARHLGGSARRRDLLAQLSSGAFLSVFVAMAAETLLIAGLAIAALLVVAALPGGEQRLEGLVGLLESSAQLQDSGQLAVLARSPWLWVVALSVASVAIPIIEESLKTVGVGLMLYRKPAREEAYLWGLAGGAGFAMTESALNSLLGLESWAATIVMRMPADLMHCFTGAMVGLAWHAAFIERRWKRGLGLIAISVSLHGVWNGLAITSSLLTLGEPSTSTLPSPWADLGAGLTAILLPAMAASIAVAFVIVTRKLRPARPSLPELPDTPIPEPVFPPCPDATVEEEELAPSDAQP